ncbi:hypothetical protein MBM_00671 [Drepanopeziza brunnea f. sp. 'multigermtubi' MB_m1]|uniref:RING-type domain-containing protein n=1 Tax=Marssonina brunnea f. sp. multigermtubi (strain MB_m1) TaxID=1072389 RepID=K1XLZ4_MARBU|nr:uncharacterized protein MBM_00671 [Drepanopeziza brunnea f. sp. 'multigermtubi' MB_m1]EKD21558.1 hypothetical protein MBM_00671 [Drepanopeziza brunnea f. sp. 'multigermtubi' MB_m1]
MCRMNQRNFFHNCTHRQIVDLPSVNPSCNKLVYGVSYLMNEWCPRCRWTGFLFPFQYREYAPGARCGTVEGNVMRNVTLLEVDYEECDKYTLWLRRQEFITGPLWDFRQGRREAEYKQVRREEERLGTSDRERTYFVLEGIPGAPIDYNRCGELFRPVWQTEIPEAKEKCAICRGDMCHDYPDQGLRCESYTFCALPCGHFYGIYCISQWVAGGGSSCPECRQEYKLIRQLQEAEEITRVPTGWNEQQIVDLRLIPMPDLDALLEEEPEEQIVEREQGESDEEYQQRRQLSAQNAQQERQIFQEEQDLVFYGPEYLRSLQSIHYALVWTLMQKLLLVGIVIAPFPFLSWTNMWMLTCGPLLFYSSCIHLTMILPRAPFERRTINRFALCSALGNTLEIIYANVYRGAEYSWWALILGIICLPSGYCAYKRFYDMPLDFPWTEAAIEREIRGATPRNRLEMMINAFEDHLIFGLFGSLKGMPDVSNANPAVAERSGL